MNNLILAAAIRNGLILHNDNTLQNIQSAIYEQQNIAFSNFILKLSKKGGNK